MARSKEALERRAQKRGRTVEEQRTAETKKARRDPSSHEPGAWKCPGCKNFDFASRDSCRSKTCKEKRPLGIFVSPSRRTTVGDRRQQSSPRPQKKDLAETTQAPKWAAQASPDQIAANQKLRARFLAAGDPELTAEEMERAKILVARDERKAQKKAATSKEGDSTTNFGTSPAVSSATGTIPTSSDTKLQAKRNKALRKRYAKTGGVGMSAADVERYNQLKERDERKRKEREERNACKKGSSNGKDTGDERKLNKDRSKIMPKPYRESRGPPGKNKDDDELMTQVLIKDNLRQKKGNGLSKAERKALRKKYKKTCGEGMSQDEIKVAKAIIEAKKRKRITNTVSN